MNHSSSVEQASQPNPSPAPRAKYARIGEYLITYGLSWIPRPLGVLLRKTFYGPVFRSFHPSVYIQSDVELIGTHAISIGKGSRILKSVRLNANTPGSSIEIGERVLLERGVDINVIGSFRDCTISIGSQTFIGPYTCISGPGSITIGENCLIAGQSGLYASNHCHGDRNRAIRDQGLTTEGICIEDDCWLGTGVKVLDGVTVGRGSVIGAGAIVNRDIPPYSIAVGVPAKVIRQRS